MFLLRHPPVRDESGLVFPSPLKPGSPMSDMTLTKILRSTGLADRATVHGFRSSFKNWTLEQTDSRRGQYQKPPLLTPSEIQLSKPTPGQTYSSAAAR